MHWAVSDYLQRSARHIASSVDVEQAYMLGTYGIKYAKQNMSNIMLTVEKKKSKNKFKWTVGKVQLHRVANVEKMLPSNFIKANGYEISNSCYRYISDLVKDEDYPEYSNGVPKYARLDCKLIKKKLKNLSYESLVGRILL